MEFCPKCGTKLSANEKFCHNCGNELEVGYSVNETNNKSPNIKSKYKMKIILGAIITILGGICFSGAQTDRHSRYYSRYASYAAETDTALMFATIAMIFGIALIIIGIVHYYNTKK